MKNPTLVAGFIHMRDLVGEICKLSKLSYSSVDDLRPQIGRVAVVFLSIKTTTAMVMILWGVFLRPWRTAVVEGGGG